jgi:hypothetical protein
MMNLLRKYVFHNFLLKVVSLGIAILLWMAVTRDAVSEIAITVPVQFQHVPAGLEISTEHPPDELIWVRGPGRALQQLDRTAVHATIDLAGVRPGEYTYQLSALQIRVPHEVEFVRAIPAQVHLSIRRAESQ